MHVHRLVKPFQGHAPESAKRQLFPETKLRDNIGNENLLRLSVGTETRRQLDRAAKDIVVLFNRLTGSGANSCLKAMAFFEATHPWRTRAGFGRHTEPRKQPK